MGSTKTLVEFEIPEGIQASVQNGVVTVKGEKGELVRNFFHPKIQITSADNKISFKIAKGTLSMKKLMHTYRAHIKNMFKGVTEGFVYKLKVCSSHFPMTVSFNNNVFEVKNFIGERVPRTLNVSEEVKVTINGDEVVLEGTNKELVGQTAASIEKLTKRPGFDRRIFQDGIYITEKDGKVLA